MNKRQKKKQVKKALDRLGTDEFTPKDKQVLMTYGRQEFISTHHHPPEVLGVDIGKVFEAVAEGIRQYFFNLGKAFIRMSGK